MKATAQKWRNRIVGLEQHKPSELLDHPHQWRTHPANQVNALRGVLEEVGIAGALVAYRSHRADGALVKIDGHARAGLGNAEWPVLVLDVDDAEADLLLATYDPLSAMAAADKEQLDTLLQGVSSGDAAVQELLADLAFDVERTSLGDASQSTERELGDPARQIKAVLYTDEIGIFEQALLKTGESNRGKALLMVCKAYLDSQDDGEG